MAKVDDLTIVISTEFQDKTSGELKKLEKQLSSSTKNIEDFEKQLKKAGSTNAEPVLSLKDQATGKLDTALDKVHKLSKETGTPSVSLKDQATPKVSEVEGKLKGFDGKSYFASLSAFDKATSVIDKIESGAKSLTSKAWRATVEIADKATQPLRNVFNWLTSIQGIATTIFAGAAFKKAVIDPVGISDFYTTAQIGFETMLGSAEKAQQMMNDINQFAIATPFEAQGLVDVSQKMIAMGWSAERVLPDLEKVGNAMSALGKGQEGIERTTLALSQMQAKGKVSAEEMRQLTEVGISAWQYVADGIGVSTAEAQDMVSKGLIPVDQAIDSIMQGMSQFDGMMDKTANATVSGLLSQLQEAATVNLWKPWGEGLAKGIRPGLSEINDLMNTTLTGSMKLGDVLNQLGEQIGSTVMNTVSGAAKNFADIISNPTFQSASLAQKVKMLMNDGVAEPIKKWWNSGGKETTKDLATSAMKTLGNALKEGFPVLIEAAFSNPITATLASSWGLKLANNFLGGLMSGMQGTKSAITNTISVVKGISNIKNVGLGGFKDAVKDAGNLTGALKQLGSASKSLSGGVGSTTKSISEMVTNFKLAYQSTGSFSQALTLARSSVSGMSSSAAGAAASTGGLVSSLSSIAPIALGVTAAVGAGVAIYTNYKNAIDQANQKQKEYLEHTDEVISASSQLNDQIQKNIQSRTASMESVGTEAVLAQDLANKIFSLKDAQDQSAGSHAQIKTLVDQLNEVMPNLALSYDESTNKITDQNGALVENKDALLDRIDALKQEAEAEAARELMTESYKDQINTLTQMNTLMPEIEDTYNRLNDAKARYNQLVAENPDGDSQQLITTRQEVENLSGKYNELRGQMSGLQETYAATGQEIDNYSAIVSGSNQTALDSTTLSVDGITQKLNELPPTSKAVGEGVGTNFADGVNSQQENAQRSGSNLADSANTGLKSTNFTDTGSRAGNDWVNSFKNAFNGIGEFFNNLFAPFNAKLEEAKNKASASQKASVAKHAEGGIMDRPHLGLIAEDGPEAIIPLGNKRRANGIKLWEEAGKRLGVYAHAEGGISSGSENSDSGLENSDSSLSSGGSQGLSNTAIPTYDSSGIVDSEKKTISELNSLHEQYLNDYTSHLNKVQAVGISSYQQLDSSIISEIRSTLNNQISLNNQSLNNYIDYYNQVVALTQTQMTEVRNIISTKLAEIINITTTNMTTFVNIITTKMNEAREVVRSTLSQMVSDINSRQIEFNNAGAGLMSAINSGMQSKKEEILAGAGDLVASLKSKFEEGLGIHSPSRWGEWVGQMIDAGVIKGMDSGKLDQFVTTVLGDMQNSFNAGKFNPYELVDSLGAGTLNLIGKLGQVDTSGLKAEQIAYPLVGTLGEQTSWFGPRESPGGIGSTNHGGVDLAAPTGTPIAAALGGNVTTAGWYGGYGNAVVIDSGNGIDITYGHMSQVLAQVGQTVQKGAQIGLVGSTGNSTGPHLHFEMHQNGSRIDPQPYIEGAGIAAGSPLASAIQSAYNARMGLSSAMSIGNIAYDISAGAAQWTPQVLQALQMLGQPADLLQGVLYAIQSESGGNPNARNDWDSNAAIGQNSAGLLQTIPNTFNAYRNPTLSANIYDPLANIYAGLNYMIQRYGSVAAVVNPRLGGWYGYEKGTDFATPGLHWVGERGPELVQFGGGERVYPHDKSVDLENKLNETGATFVSVTPPGSTSNESKSEVSVNFDSGAFQFTFNLTSDNASDLAQEFSAILEDKADDMAGIVAQGLAKVAVGTPQNGSIA